MDLTDVAARVSAALSPAQLTDYREFALATAREAAQYAVDGFGEATPERKSDGSLVTEIDKGSDLLIMKRIHAAYPDHAVLSEEQDTLYDPAHRFTWVVDPIDGTTNFARGLPIWGISIALMFDGFPIVGVLDFPLLHETFSAAYELGAANQRDAIHTAATKIPDDESFALICTRTQKHVRMNTPLKARILGAAAYHLAKVADGTGLAAVESSPKIWDLAAAYVILREAGGLLESFDGEPVFPVPPHRQDYGEKPMPIIAAANAGIMGHMHSALRVDSR